QLVTVARNARRRGEARGLMGTKALFLAAGLAAASLFAISDVRAESMGDPNAVIAIVGNQKITLGDLEAGASDQVAAAKSKLIKDQFEVYMAQRDALESRIDDALLKQEAAKEGISVDELLKRNVSPKVKDPSDEAMRIYYLGVRRAEPYEEIKPKILNTIRGL